MLTHPNASFILDPVPLDPESPLIADGRPCQKDSSIVCSQSNVLKESCMRQEVGGAKSKRVGLHLYE